MKAFYSISIPKPCHEDWSKMTPNEKGRFCQSCTKTVVDFTVMNTSEIQDYIQSNENQRICGRIHQSQLDVINLKIPQAVFNEKLNFHRLFLLALLISMGLTLFNCEDGNGKIKKIDSIEVIEKTDDSIMSKNCESNDTISKHEMVNDTLAIHKSKTINPPIPPVMGDIVEVVGIVVPPKPKGEVVFGMIVVEQPPEFMDTPKDLSRSEKKKYLSDKIQEIVKKNFNEKIADSLNLKGKQKIYTQFKIDKKGLVKDIKVRSSSHSVLEEEATRVLQLIPKLKPAKQRGETIEMVYTLPIIFMIKD